MYRKADPQLHLLFSACNSDDDGDDPRDLVEFMGSHGVHVETIDDSQYLVVFSVEGRSIESLWALEHALARLLRLDVRTGGVVEGIELLNMLRDGNLTAERRRRFPEREVARAEARLRTTSDSPHINQLRSLLLPS